MVTDYACKFLTIVNIIAIIVFGVVLAPYIFSGISYYNLDTIQKVFSIIGSLSLGVALLTYFYKKTQDETLAAIEQVSFFRKEIIPQSKIIDDKIRNKDKSYWFCRIRLNEYNIKALRSREEISNNFNNQLSIFFDISDTNPANWKIDGEILYEQVTLLNMLEEFALKVQHFKTFNHKALISLNSAFVELVERNAVALLFVRDIVTGSSVYDNVLSQYSSWKDLIEKPNILKNLKKHGLLTNVQKQQIFEERKKKMESSNN